MRLSGLLLDDALEDLRRASPVPDALGVDERDRALLADLQAVRLGAVDAARSNQAEFDEAALQEFPGFQAFRFARTLRLGLIAAEEDVAARFAHAELLQGPFQRVGHRARVCRIASRAARAAQPPACERRFALYRRPVSAERLDR